MATAPSNKIEVSLDRVYPDGSRYHQDHILPSGKKVDDYIAASHAAARAVGASIENVRQRQA